MPDWSIGKLNKRFKTEVEREVWAAVAVLLREGVKGPEVLLVKRAKVPEDPWSGDMAFPGGKRTPQDRDVFDTVRRETLEETSVDLFEEDYIGMMAVSYSLIRPERGVLPLVFYKKDQQPIMLNKEHEKYIWVSIGDLKNSRDHAIVKGWDGPIFRLGDDLVWGLTYRMLDQLLGLLSD